MASVCISECVDNTCIVSAARPTYVNLQRWSEEEKWSTERRRPRPRAADGISRRQMYLRSYTFSREDTVVPETTTQKCFGKIRRGRRKPSTTHGGRRRSRCFAMVKAAATQASSGALLFMFRRLLCCVAKVDGRSRQ